MADEHVLITALAQTRILRPPKHVLATFGTTTLDYVLLSPIPGEPRQCRLREGRVTAQRPKILTRDDLAKRFEGFGEDGEAYRDLLERAYGESLRGLEYAFKNDLRASSLEHAAPADAAERAREALEREDAPRKALIESPDKTWGLAVMKFIVDTSLRSFPVNLRELDDRGLFDPGLQAEAAQRREIEKLFAAAQTDQAVARRLGDYLRRTGLFSDYEDRFFSLIRR